MSINQIDNVIHFKKIDSTNSYGLRNLDHLEDRQIILADKQTQGKGTQNRKWYSRKQNNIYMSVILKPECKKNHHV